MTDAVTVGKLIQVLRKNKGMTQAQLAERLNISYQAVSKWESGIVVAGYGFVGRYCIHP